MGSLGRAGSSQAKRSGLLSRCYPILSNGGWVVGTLAGGRGQTGSAEAKAAVLAPCWRLARSPPPTPSYIQGAEHSRYMPINHHGASLRPLTSGRMPPCHLTSGQPPSVSGRNALPAGMVARTL